MNFTRFFGVASGIAMCCSGLAFGWSISGHVVNEIGQAIPGVSINSFNYAGISGESDTDGAFSLSNDADALFGTAVQRKISVQRHGNLLSIAGNRGTMKVSLMDALGKEAFQQEFNQQNVQIDMSKFGQQKVMILRISNQSSSENFILTQKGAVKNVLKKEGEQPAVLMFSKTGFQNSTYTMAQDVETNVTITLKTAEVTPGDPTEKSSSSVFNPWEPQQSSSSSETPVVSSSSKIEEVISCAGKTYAAGDHRMTVNVNGKNRTYIMHVPSSYKGDKAVPLVVDYHPIGGSGEGQLNGTTYKSLTDQEGVISLYPDGTSGKSPMGAGWNVGPCCSYDDDLEFSRAMINMVEEKVCIDTKRVYATGFSMGGGMSNHVACFMSDIYAAVAPAGMDLNTTNSATCNPERPISIIMFRGTNDFVCKYQGGDSGFNDGLNFLGAEKNFKFWADKNGCTGSPTTNSNGCQEYSSCKDGTKVVLCTKQGGGHEQGDGKVGWPFLKQFTMP
ncbi:MAG: feruloyl esterase [Fibrobacter sp.]|nr:feruloyl esterase [Fibrobacter sp.]